LTHFEATDLVLAIVSAAPQHRVKGKKRLQKFAYLLKSVGVSCSAEFRIWDFGPYSKEIANASEQLSMFGLLKETEEQVGTLRMFTTVYSLPEEATYPKLESKHSKVLEKLDAYSNVDLEVAATIQFFLKSGCSVEEAKFKTTQLKPTKSIPEVLRRSLVIIDEIEAVH
jgi:uncharacterized protein